MRFGQNPMQFFDKRFASFSYFWWGPKSIVLSLIDVQPEYRGKGVTTKLLETVKRYNRQVTIPVPSNTVIRIAKRKGYKMTTILAKQGRFTEEIEAMVWKPKKRR